MYCGDNLIKLLVGPVTKDTGVIVLDRGILVLGRHVNPRGCGGSVER